MQSTATFKSLYSNVFEPALLAELESKSILMNVSGGEALLRVGKPVMGVPLMLSGTIKVSRVSDEGQELLIYYIKEGETCPMSLTCFMTSQLSSVNGTAEEDCSLLVVPAKVIDELFASYASWKKFVMATILDGLTEVIKSIDEVAFKKMDDRLVSYLKLKSKVTGSSLINLTHQQIGDELGTNRVVVSRLLKKLETDNKLLLYRNQIKLLGEL
jgi:CRP/FNR family transcriptional regulator, anaerobic regulatory protein